ncbi:uncharacterized protein BX664DRAFT_265588 [Halteromyces radiatus]|uniref:uncharacterized protein n=1 Tax=Halteromyces radiatus TaxID=101107 RepID=UPI00221EB192|nr:uncharacterized protein BX664DRAFT_265588 [Halteromyces radiatus]KAI8086386.1 hypothetical protein BX664DRAFT_265588 [Halteromyces radiatus]
MYDTICNYLASPNLATSGEMKVVISTSKVAQKSYGTEKRFLCPPPSVLLYGSNWWTVDHQENQMDETNQKYVLRPPVMQIQMSNEVVGNVIRSSPVPAEPIVSGRCISKNMYISDNDEKRKTVEMLVRLRLANGLDLGVFKSKEIRVISKPSKKRQTLKNMELCIHHGTPVALFNRIRSQTVSTRYLGISNMDGTPIFYENYQPWGFNNNKQQRWKNTSQICFSSKTQTWDSFLIWIVDGSRIATEEEQEANGTSYPPPPAMALRLSSSESPVPIHYNQPVVLQCLNTGLVSPVMIIRKVDYGCSAIGGMRANNELLMRQPGCLGLGGEYNDECLGDPVSQLHKVAFQVIDNPSTLKGFSGLYPMDHQQQDHHKTCSSTLPYLDHPANYLSCMKDVVGIYCTSGQRQTLSSVTPGTKNISTTSAAKQSVRRRYSSANEQTRSLQCGGTIHRRRNSILSSTNPSGLFSNGISGIWQEDISETCVWCIVNTDTETYTFLPSRMDETQNGKDDIPVTPVPYIKQWRMIENNRMIIHGYGFTNDMVVWFGTHVAMMIRITPTELEILVPSILLGIKKNEGTLQHEEKHGKKGSQGKRTNSKDHHQENDMGKEEWIQKKVPILIVREGDGMVYRTPKWF